MPWKLPTLAAALLAAALPAGAETVRISGSTTVASAVMTPHRAAIEAASGATLEMVTNGSVFGLLDLAHGRSDVAMISAPLDLTAAKTEEAEPGSLAGLDLRAHPVAANTVGFAVHPANQVTALTLEAVGGILSGRVTNWQALGGSDLPIIIVAERAGGGLRTLAERRLTGGRAISGTVREFINATQVPIVVAQLPGAFGIVAATTAEGSGAVMVETDEAINQPLILVTSGPPSPAAQAVIDAAQTAGS